MFSEQLLVGTITFMPMQKKRSILKQTKSRTKPDSAKELLLPFYTVISLKKITVKHAFSFNLMR